MRARRVGTKSEFRLFQDEREIGHVDVASVSFRGFESRDDAALATWAAQRALTRRRRSMPHRMDYHEGFLIMDHGGTPTVVARAGVLATLLAPAAEKSQIDGWGGARCSFFRRNNSRCFAKARAMAIWRALRRTGVYRGIHQFQPKLLRVTRPPGGGVSSRLEAALGSSRPPKQARGAP
jgi:hypothetical protein